MKLTRRSFMGRLAALCGAGAVIPKVVKKDYKQHPYYQPKWENFKTQAWTVDEWVVEDYTKSVKIKRPLSYANEKVLRDMNELFESQRKMEQQFRLAALRGDALQQ